MKSKFNKLPATLKLLTKLNLITKNKSLNFNTINLSWLTISNNTKFSSKSTNKRKSNTKNSLLSITIKHNFWWLKLNKLKRKETTIKKSLKTPSKTSKIFKKTSLKIKNYYRPFWDKILGFKLKDRLKSNLISIMMMLSKSTTNYSWMLIS